MSSIESGEACRLPRLSVCVSSLPRPAIPPQRKTKVSSRQRPEPCRLIRSSLPSPILKEEQSRRCYHIYLPSQPPCLLFAIQLHHLDLFSPHLLAAPPRTTHTQRQRLASSSSTKTKSPHPPQLRQAPPRNTPYTVSNSPFSAPRRRFDADHALLFYFIHLLLQHLDLISLPSRIDVGRLLLLACIDTKLRLPRRCSPLVWAPPHCQTSRLASSIDGRRHGCNACRSLAGAASPPLATIGRCCLLAAAGPARLQSAGPPHFAALSRPAPPRPATQCQTSTISSPPSGWAGSFGPETCANPTIVGLRCPRLGPCVRWVAVRRHLLSLRPLLFIITDPHIFPGCRRVSRVE